jgi:hypothetical protein
MRPRARHLCGGLDLKHKAKGFGLGERDMNGIAGAWHLAHNCKPLLEIMRQAGLAPARKNPSARFQIERVYVSPLPLHERGVLNDLDLAVVKRAC